MVAVIEHVNRLTREDMLREPEQCHIRASPGAVHSKEAQTGGRDTVKMTVGMRHQFAGFLGGCIEAHRVVDVMVHAEGHVGVGAIDAGATGIDQVLYIGVAAALEDIDETYQVAVDVGMGVFEGVAHASLCGRVEHAIEVVFFEECLHCFAVSHVHFYEGEFVVTFNEFQAIEFELDFIVIVEVVDADDFIASFE